MAKKPKTEAVADAPDREERWEAFLAEYEKQSPEKFAAKKENGELDAIHASFR